MWRRIHVDINVFFNADGIAADTLVLPGDVKRRKLEQKVHKYVQIISNQTERRYPSNTGGSTADTLGLAYVGVQKFRNYEKMLNGSWKLIWGEEVALHRQVAVVTEMISQLPLTEWMGLP